MCKETKEKSFEELVREYVVTINASDDGNIYGYDNSNKLIYSKDNNGFEYLYNYNQNTNEICFKDPDGNECLYNYDENNAVTHYKASDGSEQWFDYDGNCISIEEYNKLYEIKKRSMIMLKDKAFKKLVRERIVKVKIINGRKYGYDKNKNCIFYRDDKMKIWKLYDEKNRCIHYKNTRGYEYWKDYNENGICVHYKDSYGREHWLNNDGSKITKKEFGKLYSKTKENENMCKQRNGIELTIEKINKLLAANAYTDNGRCIVELCVNTNVVVIKVLDNYDTITDIDKYTDYEIMMKIMKAIDTMYNK